MRKSGPAGRFEPFVSPVPDYEWRPTVKTLGVRRRPGMAPLTMGGVRQGCGGAEASALTTSARTMLDSNVFELFES